MEGELHAPVIAGLTDTVPGAGESSMTSVQVNVTVKHGPNLLDITAKTGTVSTHDVVAKDLERMEQLLGLPLVEGRIAEDLVLAVNLVGGELVLANAKPHLDMAVRKPKNSRDSVVVTETPEGVSVTIDARVRVSASVGILAQATVEVDEPAALAALARVIRKGRQGGNVGKALRRFEDACNSHVQAIRLQALASCMSIAASTLAGRNLSGDDLDAAVATHGRIEKSRAGEIRTMYNRLKHYDTAQQEQADAKLAEFNQNPKPWIDAAFAGARALLLQCMA